MARLVEINPFLLYRRVEKWARALPDRLEDWAWSEDEKRLDRIEQVLIRTRGLPPREQAAEVIKFWYDSEYPQLPDFGRK
jgi:hypothetical protein